MNTTASLIAEGAKQSELTALFSGFRANAPQLYAGIDRTKALECRFVVDSGTKGP